MKKKDKDDGLAEQILMVRQQLTFLDKKIDTLIAQLSKAPEPRFSQPQARPQEHFQNRPGRPDQNPALRQMHKAVCADCKKECEVPFRPSGDRPVYCKDCFAKRRSAQPREERNFTPRPQVAPREDRPAEEGRGGFGRFRRPGAERRVVRKRPSASPRRKKK